MATGKGPLRIAIEDFIEGFDLGPILAKWFKGAVEDIEAEGYDYLEAMYRKLGIVAAIPDFLHGTKEKGIFKKAQYDLFTIGGLIIGFIWGIASGAAQPLQNTTRYSAERIYRSARIGVVEAIRALWRDPGAKKLLEEDLADQGWTGDRLIPLTKIARPRIGEGELLAYWLRGKISEAEMRVELDARGWLPFDIDAFVELSARIPGASDLISMGVREAFNDEVSAKFKYDEDFPPEFGEWMAKQGLSADWAKRYWRAHWNLPSVTQAFEMFQRLRPGRTDFPFTGEDLKKFLRTADYPEYFRDRLTEIAYQPLTRVDVRRMFGAGVMTVDDVKEAYRDLGYNEKNTKFLTDFTTTFEKNEERGLTREAITGAYKRGLYTREQALTALGTLGYDATNADFWLDLVDYDMAAQQIDEKLEAIHQKYLNGLLDETTVYSQLGPLNLPSERTTVILDLWNVQRSNRVNIPSRGELDDFMRRDIIEMDKYRDLLAKQSYQPEVIDYFAKRITDIMTADAQAAAADAQAEQERLALATGAKSYQIERAGIDVQIADINAQVASIQVALHADNDDATIQQYKDYLDELKIAKAELVKQKAQIRLDFLTPG